MTDTTTTPNLIAPAAQLDLPPLPEPKYCADDLADIFTADQMRDYARAALARSAAPASEQFETWKREWLAQRLIGEVIAEDAAERAAQPAKLEAAQAAWTKQTVEKLSRELAEAVAKNASTVPQLTFPHIYLGLCDALLKPQPAAQAPQAGGWKALAEDDKIDASRPLDVVLIGGVTLKNVPYSLVDWTHVADWRYSAHPAAQAGEQSAETVATIDQIALDAATKIIGHFVEDIPDWQMKAKIQEAVSDAIAASRRAPASEQMPRVVKVSPYSGRCVLVECESRVSDDQVASIRARLATPASSRTTGGDVQPVAWMHKIDIDADGRKYFNAYYERTPGFCIPLYAAPASDTASASVDWLGLALDLEQQAKRVESQTVERAMMAGARGLRLMGASAPDSSAQASPVGVAKAAKDLLECLDGFPIDTDEATADQLTAFDRTRSRMQKALAAPASEQMTLPAQWRDAIQHAANLAHAYDRPGLHAQLKAMLAPASDTASAPPDGAMAEQLAQAGDKVFDGIFTSTLSKNGATVYNAMRAAGHPGRKLLAAQPVESASAPDSSAQVAKPPKRWRDRLPVTHVPTTSECIQARDAELSDWHALFTAMATPEGAALPQGKPERSETPAGGA